MAQFDVYRNPSRTSRQSAPYVVVIQSDVTQTRETVIVAPLFRVVDPDTRAQLQRAVVVNGEPFVVLFASLGAVSQRGLGTPVASLTELRDSFVKAIDLLFVGF